MSCPPALDPAAWSQAGSLLVDPPGAELALPFQGWSVLRLLDALARCRPPAQPAPGLCLALLGRRWGEGDAALLRDAADRLRRRLIGEPVSYVVNRNLNVSNHCVKHCSFCAFRRDPQQIGAYWLSLAELERRAIEAREAGATELCLQGGLNPAAELHGRQLAYAETLLRRLRAVAPALHLHAFSPQELLFFAEQDGLPLQIVLNRLLQAGLGSVPGTAAEVLSEPVRQRLCPEKLSARAWVATVLQAHRAGLPSTATLLAGHIEQPADLAAHLLTLVRIQADARQRGLRGFTEFVLLPFVAEAAPAALRARVGRDQPDLAAMLRLTALARLMLGAWIPAHQPSWVKLGLHGATEALRWGCNDLGGTLMEEHITTMAGARGGTAQTAQALRTAARRLGRPVRQRTTLYATVSGSTVSGASVPGAPVSGATVPGAPVVHAPVEAFS